MWSSWKIVHIMYLVNQLPHTTKKGIVKCENLPKNVSDAPPPKKKQKKNIECVSKQGKYIGREIVLRSCVSCSQLMAAKHRGYRNININYPRPKKSFVWGTPEHNISS